MRSMMSAAAALGASLLLAGCISWDWHEPNDFFAFYELPQNPQLENATFCHAYGCQVKSQVDLRPIWERVSAEFINVQDAAQERYAIAQAIGIVETQVGPVLGTSDDPGGVLNASWSGNPDYQDCIDEAANTTMLMVLMHQTGLVKYHAIDPPSIRGAFIDGRYQHFTAVATETDSGTRYAFDSWFRNNGRPAYVMLFRDWFTGYGIPADAI